MDVRHYTVASPWDARTVAWLLQEAGVHAEASPRSSVTDEQLFVFIESGQEADVEAVLKDSGRSVLVAAERLDPAGPAAATVRRRTSGDRSPSVLLGSQLEEPFTAEQTGVSVTLRDGVTVDMAEGRSFEVRPSGHLHVYRGERRVGVFRDDRWTHAVRTFSPVTTDDGGGSAAANEGGAGDGATS